MSGSPQCVHELRTIYPEMGFKVTPKVFHTSEFLWPIIKEGRLELKRTFSGPVMYHDPCTLGRYLGVYDEPRNILQEVTKQPVIEFSRNRRFADCCGGIGGLKVMNPKAARDIAERRLEEYREGDKKVLVTACPSCEQQFRAAGDDVEVMDLISVVARCV
ncbi:MAG: (Fe-S)-binding protein [Deltaproteobacteria bacterium]|nr:(Fe-S)-binding protein [Deltaproteobacteria bacterium]